MTHSSAILRSWSCIVLVACLAIAGECLIAAVASRLERGRYLGERSLGHSGVLAPLRKLHQSSAFIAKAHGPLERHALAGSFRERRAIGSDRLFEPSE